MLLAGRYETIRKIASGGMATVYLGRAHAEAGFERLVALKVMHSHLAEDPEFVDMFLDEARLAARIRHPNVVPTLDIQKGPDGLFLVMDYVEGYTLSAILRRLRKRDERLPVEVTLRIVLATLDGLHAAHELCDDAGESLDLVHRDISPHNILVGTDGIARITDFGVARARARVTSTTGGQVKGKLPYMAPEQILSDVIDRRFDVYSAAVVLWEALVGARLFRADSEAKLIQMVLEGVAKSPREAARDVPLAIDHVCAWALKVQPEERYPTAAAFADALELAAKRDKLAPANPRAVASFVRKLMPALDAVPESARSPDASAEFGSLGSGSISTAHSVSLSSASQPSSVSAARSGSAVVSELDAPSPAVGGRRRGLGLIGAAALIAVGVAVGWVVQSGGDGEAEDGRWESDPSPASTSEPTESVEAPPASTDQTATPVEPTAPSPDSTSDPESGTTSAPSVTTGPPVYRPPRQTPGPQPPAPTASPDTSPTAFKPERL